MTRPAPNAVMIIKGHEDLKIAVHMPAFGRAKAARDEWDLSTFVRRCGKTRLSALQVRFLQSFAGLPPAGPAGPARGPRNRWGALK